MIPFAIMSCTIFAAEEALEVRILDLSCEGFTFRLSHRDEKQLNPEPDKIRLRFYSQKSDRYETLTLNQFQLNKETEEPFYTVFRLSTTDEAYAIHAKKLMEEYLDYIERKLEGDDAALSQALIGYPAAGESVFCSSLEEQRAHWYADLKPDNRWLELVAACTEVALALDRPVFWEEYLKCSADAFVQRYGRHLTLPETLVKRLKVNYLYIGNSFCPQLFPGETVLAQLLEKALREGIHPVIVFPPMAEHDITRVKSCLNALRTYATAEQPMEVMVNDWGMLSLLNNEPGKYLSITLGILLNKRRKDSRMHYLMKHSEDYQQISQNALNDPAFRQELKERGVERISCECCGYPYQLPEGKTALHLPFFQMNTATHCTLYARCRNGDREKQSPVAGCPGYCSEYAFLYPEMLSMVGWGNSLFGFDRRSLEDGSYLAQLMEQGADRLVFHFL